MAKWVYQMTPHDEWDFDGVNEMVLLDMNKGGKTIPAVAHFDRNGFGYTLNRVTGELLVAEKYDPQVNWATKVDMKTGRPLVDKKYSPGTTGPDVDVKGICPAALGSKDEQPSSYDPATGYPGAQHAERLLGNAVLLTVAGYGHPFGLPSRCADTWRVRYLVHLVTPPPGTVCGAQRPFP